MTDLSNDESSFLDEESDEAPYVDFDLSVNPSDLTLQLIVNQLDNREIIIPFYQRKFVWKIEQASLLIESFLMGLPVPQVFLYVNGENQLEIIDGQQRILSIKYYFDGYFGDEDHKGNKKIFRLKGLNDRSEFNGKKFSELPEKYQRKLKNSTLRAINIKQLKPSLEEDSVFYIFERLNTGGTRLKPQEIRNAVYRGKIVDELQYLNKNSEWQKILGFGKYDIHQKDVEFVLRLFSLFKEWHNYEKPMISYLNRSMNRNRSFESEKAISFKERFLTVTSAVDNKIAKPFRPKGQINAATMEAVMIALMESSSSDFPKLSEKYDELLKDRDFIESTSESTADTAVLKKRISRAKEILDYA